MDINTAEQLTKLVVDNKLDYIKVGEIEIKKSIHFKPEDLKGLELTPEQKRKVEEETLFWSSTPSL